MVAPMLEVQISRTLILSHGNLAYFFGSPLSIGLYLTVLVLALYAFLTRERRAQRKHRLR
jgi:TctA family transporter